MLHEAIAAEETLDTGAHSWTLTWLEGRPRLSLDDRVLLTVTAQGSVTRKDLEEDKGHDDDDDDDDWLS